MDAIHVLPAFGVREPFAVFSHVLGGVACLLLAGRLLRLGRGDRLRTASLAVLIYASVQTMFVSACYHACWPGAMRYFLLQADVAGVFVLIAGSLTPVHIILFRGLWRWVPLLLAWTVALIGAFVRLAVYQDDPGIGNTLIFLGFGWACSLTSYEIWRRHGWSCIRPAIFAGLSYTVGATILMLHWPTLIPGVISAHEIWHVAVLSGLALHWRFVFQLCARDHWPETTIVRRPGVALPPRQLRPAVYRLNGVAAYAAKKRRERLRIAGG